MNQLKYSRDGRCPTEEFVAEFQRLIEEELRMVEADEQVIASRKANHQ